jgi:uncharacterized protein YdhG (YjbR/CyaY superfamily)
MRDRAGETGAIAASIDEYLTSVAPKARAALEKLRKDIRAAAPEATETIGYQMPMFKQQGGLVAFAAFKEHCSLFLMSTAVMEAHRDDLRAYDISKGTVRFNPRKPLPATLVRRLVKARLAENEAVAAERVARRKAAQEVRRARAKKS